MDSVSRYGMAVKAERQREARIAAMVDTSARAIAAHRALMCRKGMVALAHLDGFRFGGAVIVDEDGRKHGLRPE